MGQAKWVNLVGDSGLLSQSFPVPGCIKGWGSDGFNLAPSISSSIVKRMNRHFIFFQPFCKNFVYAINGDVPIPAVIGSLEFWSSPSTVIRSVVTIIIYSVNRMRRGWFTTHIFKKVPESIYTFPPLAHFNAPAAVQSIGSVLDLVAPSKHPSIIANLWYKENPLIAVPFCKLWSHSTSIQPTHSLVNGYP